MFTRFLHIVIRTALVMLLVAITTPWCHAQIITTVAGKDSAGYTGDGGPATLATFNSPYCVLPDAAGAKYIADYSNFVIRKVSPGGMVRTFAGNGTEGYSGDGGSCMRAEFAHITGLSLDGTGNLYIADDVNHCIRKINGAGTVTTIAGNGTAGYGGDGGAATDATINTPEDVLCDGHGNIYIADFGNRRIRLINSYGIISTVAGTGGSGYSGDGGYAISAEVIPFKLAFDAGSNLYTTEFWSNRVRKITPGGIISTFAGNGTSSFSGDGGLATDAGIYMPSGIAVDLTGEVFIGEVGSYRIRKIAPSGVISTYAGTGTHGYTGDGGPAIAAEIGDPRTVTTDATGNIYFADYDMYVVRRIAGGDRAPYFTSGARASFSLCRNASAYSINSYLAAIDSDVGQNETWSVIATPVHGLLAGFPYFSYSTGGSMTPGGLTYMPMSGYTGSDSFRVSITDGAASDTITIYVNMVIPPFAGSITGPTDVCQTSIITLTDTCSGGSWTAANGNVTVSGGLVTGINLGTDIVTYSVTNICGTSITTHAVSIDSFPSAGVISDIQRGICPGDTLFLIDPARGGAWSCSDSSVASVSNTGMTIGIAGGTDTVFYIHSNSCGADTAKVVVYVLFPSSCTAGLSTQASKAPDKITIYPNPNSGEFTLTIPSLRTQATFTITDLLGKTILSTTLPANTSSRTLSLETVPAGTYFIQIDGDNRTLREKLVVW